MKVTLNNTIGAGFLGSVGASILYGITLMQVYMYYLTYPKDWLFQKITVAALLAFDTFHLIITTVVIYHYCIDEYGNPKALQGVVWSFKLQVLLNVIIVLSVQSLYVLRIWKLGRRFNRIWPLIVIGIQCGGYAVGILLAVKTYQMSSWTDLDSIGWVVNTTFSTSTGIDILVAGSMCYYLNRSKSSFVATNHRIVAIMRYVLATGSLTSASSVCALVTYATMPNNFIFLGVSFLVTKLYINSYLVMLNARRSIRGEKDSTLSISRMANMIGPTSHLDHSTDPDGDAKESHPLSSIAYRARLDGDADAKHHKQQKSSGILDIKVSRTEETVFDKADGNWNRV